MSVVVKSMNAHARSRAEYVPLREAPVALDALRSLPGGSVLVFDRDLRYVLAAGGALKKHGYAPADLEGQRCADVVPAYRWAVYEPLYRAAVNGEETVVEVDSVDGASRFAVEVGPLRDERGEVIGGVAISRDVTAVRQLQAEARLTERALQAAFDESPAGMIRASADGQLIEVNQAFAEMLGYSRDALAGMTVRDITHPEDMAAELEGRVALITATGGRRQLRAEKRYVRADGEVVWGFVSAVLVEVDGDPPQLHVQVIDITAGKRSARELAEARRDIDRFFGLSLDVMAIANHEGHFVRVNPAFEQTLGYSIEDLTGRPFAEFVHPDDLEPTLGKYAELLAGSRAIGFENRYRCQDGSFRWLLWNATAIEDGFVYCTARDVTERKQLEASVREAEELLALSFDHSPLGMTLTLPDQPTPRINRAFADMLGYTVEELRATKDPQTITHPDDRATDQEIVRTLVDGDANAAQWEKRYIHADGHTVSALVSATRLRHPDGSSRVLIAQIEDITERKLMEQRLRQLADHDSLTGLRNRRTFEEAVILQVARCQRYGEKATLLLIDLNNFKQINDTHGHKPGDDVLKAVAGAIQQRVRATDYPARIGGDEFAVLLPHTGTHQAVIVARGIERAIADTTVQLGAAALRCRASIGIATIDESTPDAEAALLQADRAMYAVKRRKASLTTTSPPE